MGKSVTITFIKQSSGHKDGTLYLRTIEDRKASKRSLGIKITESNWKKFFNAKIQRFRNDERFQLADELNDKIELALSQFKKNDFQLEAVIDSKKSFLNFWKELIRTQDNHGTRIKHEVILAKLNKFLSASGTSDLKFLEINPQFLRNLKQCLMNTADPKRLSENSVNHYMKVIKSVLRKAAVEDYYVYPKDPFASINFTARPVKKTMMNGDELVSLMRMMYMDDTLKLTRDMFVFQVFTNGMRVSDLLLLKWRNIERGRITYTMFKTTKVIAIPMNIQVCSILNDFLDKPVDLNKARMLVKFPMQVNGKAERVDLSFVEKEISKIAFEESVTSSESLEKLEAQIKKGLMTKYLNYIVLNENYNFLVELIDARERLIKLIDDTFIDILSSTIVNLPEKSRDKFVFPLLDNLTFSGYSGDVDHTRLTEMQYKKVKHATIMYNRRLKKIGDFQGLKLSSHAARHSYTNLMLTMNDVNLYDLSQSLGHSSIAITQNYINSGFNKDRVDHLNREFSRQFRF
jgi:integrase